MEDDDARPAATRSTHAIPGPAMGSALPRRVGAATAALLCLAGLGLVGGCEDDAPTVNVRRGDGGPRPDTGPAELPRGNEVLCLSLVFAGNGASQVIRGDGSGGAGELVRSMTTAQGEAAMGCPDEVDGRRVEAATIGVWTGDIIAASLQGEISRSLPGTSIEAETLAALPLEVIAVGDRDFDFGPEALRQLIEGVAGTVADADGPRRPFVASTIDVAGSPLEPLTEEDQVGEDGDVVERQSLFQRALVTVDTWRIGFVVANHRDLDLVTSPREVTSLDPAGRQTALQSLVDGLREDDGADRVVLIAHTESRQADRELVASLRGVDAVLSAGDPELHQAPPGAALFRDDRPADEAFPQYFEDADGFPVPLAAVRGRFRYTGTLRLLLSEERVQVVGPREDRVRATGEASDPSLAGEIDQFEEDFVRGTTLATTEVALSLGAAGRSETNAGNLVADAVLWEARNRASAWLGISGAVVQAALVPAQELGETTVPVGELAEGSLRQLVPGDGVLASNPMGELLTGQELKVLLEAAVAGLPEDDGRFLQVAGIEVVVDPAGAAQVRDDNGEVTREGARIVSVTTDDGTPIVEEGLVVTGAQLRVVAPGSLLDGT
ncbi:MAG TPA: 5'-nucleotidase C-terminal domain-containing protein, partial [Polyangiaceae bacterium LLY-WYZ-14_1]|nr:5'-nucleotidase C-terminal domain-containing protein [Polyangiaceae bacterium LLY-WYZ-14_1]